MRAIIIDDEKNAVITIELIVKEYCPEVEIVGTALSAKQGIEEINTKKPDLVFLDIQMPHISGIELLEMFGENRDFDVIFVTAFNDFAVKAFRLSATDYLLKPINFAELINAIKRLIAARNSRLPMNQRMQNLKAALSRKIAVPNTNGTEFISLDDIIRIQADGSYATIFCVNKQKLMVSKNLGEFETSLQEESFFRVHKSHLINFQHIKKYSPTKDGGYIEMSDGSTVEVARTHKNQLTEILKVFVK